MSVFHGADEEDYFSKEDDDDEEEGGGGAGVSGRVGNGVVHPVGTVTGTFSLRSLVDYDDDDDEEMLDGKKGASTSMMAAHADYCCSLLLTGDRAKTCFHVYA